MSESLSVRSDEQPKVGDMQAEAKAGGDPLATNGGATVGVIIPSYNSGATIGRTLDHLQA